MLAEDNVIENCHEKQKKSVLRGETVFDYFEDENSRISGCLREFTS